MQALRSSRGQTLVLFALSLLLLTLMVALTLSMSMKVRERTELQTVADAAAYSNAVATARTFNNLAVLNRAQIAFAVSQAGVQSLVSWSSAYSGYVNGSVNNMRVTQAIYAIFAALCACAPFNGFCAQACRCGIKGIRDTNNIIRRLNTERNRLRQAHQALDPAAAALVFRTQMLMSTLGIYGSEQLVYQDLKDKLGDQDFTKTVVNSASAGAAAGEWSVPSASGRVSEDEVSGGPMCATGKGAACDLPLTVAHAVSAAMGSRGYPFVSGRTNPIFSLPFNLQLLRVLPPPDIAFVMEHSGSGWFTQMHSGRSTSSFIPPYAPAAGADDHGTLFTMYSHMAHGGGLPCPPVLPWVSQVQAQIQASGFRPVHTWTGGSDPSPAVHRLIPCLGGLSSCPGIWPPFIDYNITQVNQGDNNFGQPKNFAMVRRNPAARAIPDPFNLTFNFKFTGAGTRFDNRTPATATQTALSTGIAYYHRGALLGFQHWNEPPNLLNPYWRATLVAADTDDSGLDDAEQTLRSSGDAEGGDTLRALIGQGFKGFQ